MRASDEKPEITDDQIRVLRDEAGAAGDLEQVIICDAALGHDGMDWSDDQKAAARRVYDRAPKMVWTEHARAECARVIAEVQVDDEVVAIDPSVRP